MDELTARSTASSPAAACKSGYILYRGSRDELNEMCRVKDERIAELEAALRACIARAGIPNALDACRAVIRTAENTLNRPASAISPPSVSNVT